MHGLACCLVAASAMGLEVPETRRSFTVRESDFALATAGLQPFTPETNDLSLRDWWRQFHQRKPDLIISKVILEPREPKVGESFAATLYYKNIGGKTATRFYLARLPGPFGQAGFGLGGDYARLDPGEEKPYIGFGGTAPKEPGLYTLVFLIDPNREVDESNHHNNRFAVTIRVVPRPD